MPVIEGIPGLAILMSLLLLLALAYAYDNTLGALLQAVARWFRGKTISIPHVTSIGFGFIADAAESLDGTIRHYLAAAIHNLEYAWHRFVHWNAYAWQEVSGAVADLAEGVEQSIAHLVERKIPGLVHSALSGVRRELDTLEAEVDALLHRVDPRIGQALRSAEQAVSTAESSAAKIAHEVEVGIPHAVEAAIAGTLPRIRDLERDAAELKARLGKVARTLTPAGIVGLVAAALASLKLGWLKCSNVERTAKHICGMDEGLLTSLLADATLILGTVSLVEFAKGMQGAVDEIVPPVRKFWRAT